MKAPAFRPYSGKLVFPEDVLREEEERRRYEGFLCFSWVTRSPLRLLHEKLVKTWGRVSQARRVDCEDWVCLQAAKAVHQEANDDSDVDAAAVLC